MKINDKEMKKNATRAAKLLKSLANPSRLLILCSLVGGEKSAGELWKSSTLSQSAFSQHLAVLRREKIVITRKDAQNVYYSLADDNAVKVLNLMYELFCS
ncbi:MAG TPA: metalloregulator ArsR/SmtB family transcription factor [Gammaproteobacteria bacterium]|jgi:DNA-binding transcriptional ArsR family regulator|nr:metalloregulator ArsR/SmtB family transcription factor [Gammaproteobacteria bacterium]